MDAATTPRSAPGPGHRLRQPASVWDPLREPLFRALWTVSLLSNIGTLMQGVGGAWLMTSLTPSPALVALMQSATSLPVFLVGLPAGALADVVDRRRLLLAAQAWMLVCAAILSALTLTGATTPWLLLALTFALGLGNALNGPAWQAIVPELVAPPRLAAAVALNGASFNLARAVGPALGGLVVAALGPGINFLLNAASYLGTIAVLRRWRRPPAPAGALPAEQLLGAMQAGWRYAQHAPELRAVLVRVGLFAFCASALWALLPLVARRELNLEASGYGLLLSSVGLGAVGGAAVLPRVGARWSADTSIVAATALLAGMLLALGSVPHLLAVCTALTAAGAAWMLVMSSFNVAAQTAAADWVRARALGTYLLVFQGVMGVGSAVWGALAERVGDPAALGLAAAGLVLGLGAIPRWRLRQGNTLHLRPSAHWPEPRLATDLAPGEGPVMVTVEYRVAPEHGNAFARAMQDVGRQRRRDGAERWGLYRDGAEPDRYLETFLVGSWGEHLRQHARATLADQAVEQRAYRFLEPGSAPAITHLVAATPDDTGGADPGAVGQEVGYTCP